MRGALDEEKVEEGVSGIEEEGGSEGSGEVRDFLAKTGGGSEVDPEASEMDGDGGIELARSNGSSSPRATESV